MSKPVSQNNQQADKDQTPISLKRPRRRRKIIILIQLLLALGLFSGIWFSFRATTEIPSLAAHSYLGNLPLVSQVTGQEAISQTRELHGKEIGLVDGYIAQYQAYGSSVMVWVGQAESSSAAKELLEAMTERIGEGNEDFRNLEKIRVDGAEVYSTVGGGERHYYYQSADKVVWLAVRASEPLELVREALRTIR